jgi:hypothetical protein
MDAQNGININVPDDFVGTETDVRYIITPRNLAYWVHVDALY